MGVAVAVVIGPAAAAALTRLVGVARRLADTTGVADGSLLEGEKKLLQEISWVQVITARRISVADPGCLSWIPIPGSEFFSSRTPDPIFSIPDPHQRI